MRSQRLNPIVAAECAAFVLFRLWLLIEMKLPELTSDAYIDCVRVASMCNAGEEVRAPRGSARALHDQRHQATASNVAAMTPEVKTSVRASPIDCRLHP